MCDIDSTLDLIYQDEEENEQNDDEQEDTQWQDH